jgi:hypothetical protein
VSPPGGGDLDHNWASRHTDRCAWGQVAGFDTHPESFLEVATTQRTAHRAAFEILTDDRTHGVAIRA